VHLDLVSKGLVRVVAPAEGVGRVDGDLAFETGHLTEGIRDRAGRHGDEDDVGGRRIAAVAPEERHLVPGLLPTAPEPATDVSPTERDDVHRDPPSWAVVGG
jgi:hypothetical protein